MNDLVLDEHRSDPLVADDTTHQPGESPTLTYRPASDLPISGVRLGVLVAIKDDGRTPLVVFLGQRGSAAVAARTTMDMHGVHIGREVVLMFEDGDPGQPIVIGCIVQTEAATTPSPAAGTVEVEGDGERLLVSAKEQLVLRCGKTTITLTKAGKVLIQGTYISSRSSGVNRVKGGSIQLN